MSEEQINDLKRYKAALEKIFCSSESQTFSEIAREALYPKSDTVNEKEILTRK